jgi:hypothetical protein
VVCVQYSSGGKLNFFLISRGGVRPSPLGTSFTIWPVVPAPDVDEVGPVGGPRTGKEIEVLRENLPPVRLCLPQIPHDMYWTRPPRWEAADCLSYDTTTPHSYAGDPSSVPGNWVCDSRADFSLRFFTFSCYSPSHHFPWAGSTLSHPRYLIWGFHHLWPRTCQVTQWGNH